MCVVFWHTVYDGRSIGFLFVLLGFLCFGRANVECLVLNLPERFLYFEYFTVLLYAVPPVAD